MNISPDPSITLATAFEDSPNFVLISILILVGLLLFSAFFSLSETAFTSLNEIRIENLAKKHNSAKLVMKLNKHYDRVLSTILIGTIL